MQTRTYLTHRRPAIFQPFTDLIVGESTRLGGVSPEPYASLNLGLHTDDDPDNVAKNRARFCRELGIPVDRLAGSHQVHGSKILEVQKAGNYEGFDALITQKKHLYLTVTVADCTPVLVCDPVNQVVAAVHAGWKGTAAGIVAKTLDQMMAIFGTQPNDCYAYVGTCIDECSFEVDADVADEFAASFKRWDADKGKYFIDLKAANREQLLKRGLPSGNIGLSQYSTYLNNDQYFSYRKERGKTGRMLALIGFKD